MHTTRQNREKWEREHARVAAAQQQQIERGLKADARAKVVQVSSCGGVNRYHHASMCARAHAGKRQPCLCAHQTNKQLHRPARMVNRVIDCCRGLSPVSPESIPPLISVCLVHQVGWVALEGQHRWGRTWCPEFGLGQHTHSTRLYIVCTIVPCCKLDKGRLYTILKV